MDLLFDLYGFDESYDPHKLAFLINYQIWAYNHVKTLEFSGLGHILFYKEPMYIHLGLLELRDHIEQGSFFIPALVEIPLEH